MPNLVAKWQRVRDLLGDIQAVAYVTTTEWAELAKEINVGYATAASPKNFEQIKIGHNLLVCNSHHDNQDECDLANTVLLGEENLRLFKFRRDNWITGKDGKPKIEPQLIPKDPDVIGE